MPVDLALKRKRTYPSKGYVWRSFKMGSLFGVAMRKTSDGGLTMKCWNTRLGRMSLRSRVNVHCDLKTESLRFLLQWNSHSFIRLRFSFSLVVDSMDEFFFDFFLSHPSFPSLSLSIQFHFHFFFHVTFFHPHFVFHPPHFCCFQSHVHGLIEI